MEWKKLLGTKDLIAYEKNAPGIKARIEARRKNKSWLVYKTYNFLNGDDWVSKAGEYVTSSIRETRELIDLLQKENDISLKDAMAKKEVRLDLKRIYKEDFFEKWKFGIDSFNEDNFIFIRYGDEVWMDIIMHERYNSCEKQILEKVIDSLGIKGMADKIKYDFFYYKKHSAKKRIYVEKDMASHDQKVESSLDNGIGNDLS